MERFGTAWEEAVEKLTRQDFSRSMLQHNQEFQRFVRNGVPVSYRDAKGQLAPGTPLFALQGERIVAAAGVYGRSVAGVTSWEVGWVACHPCHAGKGLGRAATAAAVQAALTLERRPIVLKTDDHRIAAVKSYLRLGFVPEYGHPTYPSRWEAVFAKLGPESAPNDREA